MFKRLNTLVKVSKCPCRNYATAKTALKVDESVLDKIKDEVYKPKQHPGINKLKSIALPESFIQTVHKVLADYPVKAIQSSALIMQRHLKGRVPPMEAEEISDLKQNVYQTVLNRESKRMSDLKEDKDKFKQSIKDQVLYILKKKVYNWAPMTYDARNCLVYLVGRTPAEYAVLAKIFSELKERDKMFNPRSMFDFGSGTGSASWATKLYWNNIYEYYNVDPSSFMNDLALTLLMNGNSNANQPKGVYYRQFFPANNTTYDLVVSAYTLLELPSFEARIEAILKLWNKTQNYLVIVEQGTNAGFKVINEVRDFLITLEGENQGHVFSPCPHEHACPRFSLDNTPCNYTIAYSALPVGAKVERKNELYSYIVMKRGARSPDDPQWPRIEREVLVRPRHTICRLCTKYGKISEMIFTSAKNGKETYHCARASKWGDRLPINVEEIQK